MKYRDPKTGEVFEEIEAARIAFCGMACQECKLSCWNNKDKTRCDIYCRAHPAEAARLMGLEVVEDRPAADSEKSLFCEHIGVSPGQPFIVHGYPYRNYAPMVYGEDGCVRLYAPDGQKRHKVGGRAITWMVDHPERVEPCVGYTPQEVAFRKEEPMEKKDKPRIAWDKIGPKTAVWCKTEDEAKAFVEAAKKRYPERCRGWDGVRTYWDRHTDKTCYVLSFNGDQRMGYSRKDFYVQQGYTIISFAELLESAKPRICEVLGVEVGERFRVDYPKGMTAWLHINEDGSVEREGGANRFKIGNSVVWAINHPDRIIRKPRFTPEEVADAKEISRILWDAASLTKYANGVVWIFDNNGKEITRAAKGLFPSLRPGQAVKLEEIIG